MMQVAGLSIKDNTRKRKQQNIPYAIINFTGDTEFEGKQEEFFFTGRNKQLIKLMS